MEKNPDNEFFKTRLQELEGTASAPEEAPKADTPATTGAPTPPASTESEAVAQPEPEPEPAGEDAK